MKPSRITPDQQIQRLTKDSKVVLLEFLECSSRNIGNAPDAEAKYIQNVAQLHTDISGYRPQ